ncbi:PA14 domain-containing protein [Streptomyces flavofungini]|uniref:PA14 domain-containing protein n=1 Tax=Streptomyces flavofungini TaxID=68200 RepID=UPI003F53FBF1
MYAQLKELVDTYDPALLWFDGEWDTEDPHNPWTARDGERLESYLRGLNPDLVINNRVGKRRVTDGDYGTPEQEIFDNADLAGAPKVTRTDPTVNHAWKFGGSPHASIPSDRFSVRWTGSIEPRRTETYTLTTVSGDVVRVWIDGRLVIDSWNPHEPKVDKAQVPLTAGERHSIRVDYAENTGEAHMKLLWSSPDQPQQIVPSTQLRTR